MTEDSGIDFIREQALIYRLLIADLQRRNPELAAEPATLSKAGTEDAQRIVAYRASLALLLKFLEAAG
ncbi:hypothetical protein J2T08_006314 [Neorhizobium galegae]|uniref:hypothetical protein n=1 Tax=Neorhizobium galegae TaxID=399 RepID=UPI001AE4CDBD|nr:hypothetical protein [Neorhizobium galegae]MBP2562329.1 hypothetical protein [Neorhizobium galegae]MDQ0138369.1 hypothetical protein [Neorhizobium galegae]